MFEAGRRYSDTPVAGVSLGPVDTAVLARLVSEGFARYDTASVTTVGETTGMGGFVRAGPVVGPAYAAIDPTTGALVNPRVGASLTVPCALNPMMTVWSLRVTSADSADTVTVYEMLGGVETSIGTLSVPAGDSISDSYQKQFGATYRCAQAGSATLTAEVM